MAGELPTSHAGNTLISPSLIVPDPNAYGTTPALAQLNDALKNGLVDYNQVMDTFLRPRKDRLNKQLMDEETQNSKDRMEIAPLKKKLTADQLNAAIELLPETIVGEKQKADIRNELFPGQKKLAGLGQDADLIRAKGAVEIAPDQVTAAKNEIGLLNDTFQARKTKAQNDLELENSNFNDRKTLLGNTSAAAVSESGMLKHAADLDPTGTKGYVPLVKSYMTNFGPPPVKADGTGPDFDQMQKTVDAVAKLKLAVQAQKPMTPLTEAIIKEAARKGLLSKITDAQTGGLSADAAAVVDAAPEPLDPKELGNLQQNLRGAQEALGKLQKMRAIVHDTTTEPVGPRLDQGAYANQLITEGKSLVGLAKTKFEQQRTLDRELAGQISNTIRELAGTGNRVMASEIDPKTGTFFKAMPSLKDTPKTWEDWITEKEAKFNQVIKDSLERLPESDRTSRTAPAVKPVPAGRTAVSSVAEARKLPSGTPFQLPDGTQGTTP